MATTHDTQDTQDAHNAKDIQAIKQEIISELDQLTLTQLRHILALINSFTSIRRGISGAEFVAWVSGLRDQISITDEEFDEFERILREADEAGKQRFERPS